MQILIKKDGVHLYIEHAGNNVIKFTVGKLADKDYDGKPDLYTVALKQEELEKAVRFVVGEGSSIS